MSTECNSLKVILELPLPSYGKNIGRKPLSQAQHEHKRKQAAHQENLTVPWMGAQSVGNNVATEWEFART